MARIGTMRHRVAIYARTDAEAGNHSALVTCTLVDTVWARVENVSGTQQVDSRNAGAGVTHRITIRHRSDVTKKNEIQYDGRWYRIQTVQCLDEDRKRFLAIECEQLDAVGTLENESPESI